MAVIKKENINSKYFVCILWQQLIFQNYLHIPIIGHYPSFRTTANLLTPLMFCALSLYVTDGAYSLTLTLNPRFEKLCYCRFEFLSEFWEKIAEEIFFFSYFFEAWPVIRTLALRQICQHTLINRLFSAIFFQFVA